MIDLALANSRPLATASRILNRPLNAEELFSRSIVLTGSEDALASKNGQHCFIYSLRLLLRIAGLIEVRLPRTTDIFRNRVEAIMLHNDFRGLAKFSEVRNIASEIWAVLCVGNSDQCDSRWIHVSANGWISTVSAKSDATHSKLSQTNPAACLLAASLGVSEIFKKLIAIPNEVAPPLAFESFSLFELSSDFSGLGPLLPDNFDLPGTLQVGAGAIGNGVALVLPDLGANGSWHIVDKQTYAPENLGTCVLMEKNGWIGTSKAGALADWLRRNSSLIVTDEQALIKDALGGPIVNALRPTLLMNGLDDVQARHDSQLAWPDVLIDGGINDVGAAVFQHRFGTLGLACLRCGFALAKPKLSKTYSEITGLNEGVVGTPDALIDDSHIAAAPSELQAWLKLRKGKSVCSVLSEATLSHLGIPAEESFRPSVPFVATAAAALMVGEMIKAIINPDSSYLQRFTMGNLFLGASHSSGLNAAASSDCICVRQREAIGRWRVRCNGTP